MLTICSPDRWYHQYVSQVLPHPPPLSACACASGILITPCVGRSRVAAWVCRAEDQERTNTICHKSSSSVPIVTFDPIVPLSYHYRRRPQIVVVSKSISLLFPLSKVCMRMASTLGRGFRLRRGFLPFLPFLLILLPALPPFLGFSSSSSSSRG